MPENPTVAIVILNWNGKKLFDIFLPSVIRHSVQHGIDIYVADNGSTDDSVAYLSQHFPEIKMIILNKNFGFAEGYNQALKQVKATYYILLNSDVEVTQGWISPCVNLLENDPHLAVVQPKILSYNRPHTFEYAGAGGGFIDKFGYPFCRGRILNHTEQDKGQYNAPSSIFWASGACMFIKAEMFHEAGGFDSTFWAHMEEIDLCWRLKNKGYKIMYQPGSKVYHLGGGTLPYSSPQKIYLNFRNNLFMLYKNLPDDKFHRIIITRIFLDQVAAVKFFMGFYYSGFKAVIQAHISFFKAFFMLRKKRKKLKKQVVVSDHPEIYPKSIMWKFFIKRKRKFSDLNF
jgi:GT2 family glycosyltransferase